MLLNILIWSGLFLYIINYAIGWSLYFGLIRISKISHQIIFSAIIVNLIAVIFFLKLFSLEFIICLFSLLMMVLLPLGRSGGKYHRTVSSTGFALYLILFLHLVLTKISF
jgi:hypothetical protein